MMFWKSRREDVVHTEEYRPLERFRVFFCELVLVMLYLIAGRFGRQFFEISFDICDQTYDQI